MNNIKILEKLCRERKLQKLLCAINRYNLSEKNILKLSYVGASIYKSRNADIVNEIKIHHEDKRLRAVY